MVPAQRIQPCFCVQEIPASVSENAVQEKEKARVAAVVETLKSSLSLPRENTSATVRKFISAPDDRLSSFAMGTFAIVTMSLLLAIVLSFDAIRFVLWLRGSELPKHEKDSNDNA